MVENSKMKFRRRDKAIIAISILFLLGCGGTSQLAESSISESETPQAIVADTRQSATRTPRKNPTVTTTIVLPTITLTPLDTPVITETSTPTETPEPKHALSQIAQATVLQGANLRAGPNMQHEVIGSASLGETLPVFAKSEDGWILVNSSEQIWIGSSLLELEISLTNIPIFESAEGVEFAIDLTEPIQIPTVETTQTGSQSDCTEPARQINEEGNALFSVLEISEVIYDDGFVHVSGCTDLPDETKLSVTFDITGYDPDDTWLGVSENAIVTNGRYETTIMPPSIPQFQEGPYEVEVMLYLGSQSDSVSGMLGEHGEFIEGENAWQLMTGDTTMKNHMIVDMALEIEPPTYPKIDPSKYEIDSAERTMAEYLLAWQNQDWATMASHTQLTWREDYEDPATELMFTFGFKEILGGEIIAGESFSEEYLSELNLSFEVLNELGAERDIVLTDENFRSIPVILDYSILPTESERGLTYGVVVREDGPYSPSKYGNWGVNPISMFAVKDISTSE